ncbi:hypothetical protein WOLCODRAFT_142773 [Wolfiporia cocos MD-104 SS10]|uniref:Uncharacterized protein n=1 Tax=Wolfiporia cocos (strain MD-104) TaxID=742152 RepID=A0A2H3JLW1_WOLCO|nr:hypothetical protein WOLCODRAFT_142773 [Wolfiporia cocos MD-104 SS10]
MPPPKLYIGEDSLTPALSAESNLPAEPKEPPASRPLSNTVVTLAAVSESPLSHEPISLVDMSSKPQASLCSDPAPMKNMAQCSQPNSNIVTNADTQKDLNAHHEIIDPMNNLKTNVAITAGKEAFVSIAAASKTPRSPSLGRKQPSESTSRDVAGPSQLVSSRSHAFQRPGPSTPPMYSSEPSPALSRSESCSSYVTAISEFPRSDDRSSHSMLDTMSASPPSRSHHLALLPSPSEQPPQQSSVAKGKEAMPNIRALVSELRAAGKLDGPPPLEYSYSSARTSRSKASRYPSGDANSEATSSRHAPENYDVSAIEHDFAEMDVDPHDIEDMYKTPAPELSVPMHRDAQRAGAGTAERGGASQHGRRVDVKENKVPGILFDWLRDRFATVENGRRDEVDRILSWKSRHCHHSRGLRERRKGVACYLTAKARRKQEKTMFNFSILSDADRARLLHIDDQGPLL